jgi:hypothetical protein
VATAVRSVTEHVLARGGTYCNWPPVDVTHVSGGCVRTAAGGVWTTATAR